MNITAVLFLLLGLALLVAGAELLVRGAARLALRFGISPLVIGLTVVAFGTSAPELAVTVQAGLAGQSGLAIGNIIGSNIFNVLLVLGMSALIAPLVVSQQLVRLDVPLMIGAALLLWILALDGRIGLFDGLLLTAGIVAYTAFAIVRGAPRQRLCRLNMPRSSATAEVAGWGGCRCRSRSSSAAWRCWCSAPIGWSPARSPSRARSA